jgi:hypothetical protein
MVDIPFNVRIARDHPFVVIILIKVYVKFAMVQDYVFINELNIIV